MDSIKSNRDGHNQPTCAPCAPGDTYTIGGWETRAWNPWLSTSLRSVVKVKNHMHGADPDLNPTMVPTADPESTGGKSIDVRLGVNLYIPRGILSGNRFSVEFVLPTYQSLNGPQLATDWGINFGWQDAFSFDAAFLRVAHSAGGPRSKSLK